MASKYTNVITLLPKSFGTEPKYQEKVEAVKLSMLAEPDFDPSASSLARKYTDLRAKKDRVEDVLSKVNLFLEAVKQLVVDRYEVEGVSSLKIATGETIRTQPEPYAAVEDKDANRLWCLSDAIEEIARRSAEGQILDKTAIVQCLDMGLGRALSLHWQTLNSITKERLLEGESEPEGVRLEVRTKVVLMKAS